MSHIIEKAEKLSLPVIPLRGLVAFPMIPINFELQREASLKACDVALDDDMYVFLVAQKDISNDNPLPGDLYKIGCVTKIRHSVKTAEGTVRVMAECVCRGHAAAFFEKDGYYRADVISQKMISDSSHSDVRTEALVREALRALENMMQYMPSGSPDIYYAARAIKSPGALADFIASNAFVKYQDKQKILECIDPKRRIELVSVIIESELSLIKAESQVHKKVKEQIDENQREYYLREQLKAIQSELGLDSGDDAAELSEKIRATELPNEVEEKLNREVARLAKTPFGSPEATVSRGYIEKCLEIPWNKKSRERLNVKAAEKILNSDHEGLEKVKERILEYIAVKQMTPELRNQIICFVGPPGVGKTSLGRSVAAALNRKYARISLGGVHDESDIRGHRKTYIGSMPGRIINALIEAGTMNPVLQLDEIDKLGSSVHGDPTSAMLEVLDSEQNSTFRDHFIELPVDLSDCLFLASANTLETIPAPLIDRMEIIELHTYTPREKFAIAKNHLIPKQLTRHGLNRRMLKISDDAVYELIDGYTRESGVRNLEREIASLCRKAAKYMIENCSKSVTVSRERVRELLGERRFLDDEMYSENQIGVVNGLAYTEVGGDLLKIEAILMNGTGKFELTGTLGDVMKESAHIALSYVRAHSNDIGTEEDFYKKYDIHIHVPEGAVPKDGPSAGVTMVSALASALSGRSVRCDTAMTGEVTLTGRVLPIGGLREKTTAAYTKGIKRVIIPEGNLHDLQKIDPIVREELIFIPVKDVKEVLDAVLEPSGRRIGKSVGGEESCDTKLPNDMPYEIHTERVHASLK